jgi:hypothetical protein
MKQLLTGLGIFILGFIFLNICSTFWGSGDSNFPIVMSILYLSAIIAGSASLILDAIREGNDD